MLFLKVWSHIKSNENMCKNFDLPQTTSMLFKASVQDWFCDCPPLLSLFLLFSLFLPLFCQ